MCLLKSRTATASIDNTIIDISTSAVHCRRATESAPESEREPTNTMVAIREAAGEETREEEVPGANWRDWHVQKKTILAQHLAARSWTWLAASWLHSEDAARA